MLASSPVHAAAERIGGAGLAFAAGAFAAAFCALFFSGGFADSPLVWIGAITLGLAAAATAAAALRLTPAPALDRPVVTFLSCLFGLALWMGVSTLWSLSPNLTWGYTNRTLVYAAFALLGVLLAAILPRPAVHVARAAAVLLALVLGWALLAKSVPALYGDYGRVARLRAPLGYWNELALLADVAVPVALWIAAPRRRTPAVRAAGVVLLYAAVVTALLTYSRFGVALAVAAAAAWVVLESDRVESLVAAAVAAVAGAGAFGVALALDGITKDGQSHAARVHDGWIFALAVLGLGAARGRGRVRARARRDAPPAHRGAPPPRRADRRDRRGRRSSSPASPRARHSPDGSGTSSRIPSRARSPRTPAVSRASTRATAGAGGRRSGARSRRIRSAAPGPARSSSPISGCGSAR